MKLSEFLEIVDAQENDIVVLKGKEALEAVKRSGYALRYVKEQTPELCLEAVKRSGDALQYVKEQTPELCLEAVKEDGDALRYVDKSIWDADGNTRKQIVCQQCNGKGSVDKE
jgi:hypothetical protein